MITNLSTTPNRMPQLRRGDLHFPPGVHVWQHSFSLD